MQGSKAAAGKEELGRNCDRQVRFYGYRSLAFTVYGRNIRDLSLEIGGES